MEDWWENWFSDLDMDIDKSFNQCQRNSPRLGHCSSDSGTDASVQGTKRVRSSWKIQDHIMSERKRRHEMAEKFIQLSSIIPGLKKIDKVSVLGEAINHVKNLKQRIAMLEQQSYERRSTKSIISIRKSQSYPNGSNLDCTNIQELLEVEAIGIESEKELLIRIHCEKLKGILLKLLALLESMDLSVSTSSMLPFGKNALHITIIAKMGKEYKIKEEALVKKLRHDIFKLFDMQHVIHASVSLSSK
ncbi:transcription factor bHLH18 [Trifolium repens]|nr:transcription factor bHLH18 [Trifolium repens]